jgi:hypothetical protein
MKIIIILSFLLLLIGLSVAKCGVSYHSELYKSSWKYDKSYAYLSNNRFCNDIEMFEQCKRAREKLDHFVNLVLKKKHININYQNLLKECHESISCYYDGMDQGDYWCENMDLYDTCIVIKDTLADYIKIINDRTVDHVIPMITCKKNDHLTNIVMYKSDKNNNDNINIDNSVELTHSTDNQLIMNVTSRGGGTAFEYLIFSFIALFICSVICK